MSRNESDLRGPVAPQGPEMIAAMRRGVVEALREHKGEGQAVIAWDRVAHKVVEIPADQIVIPEDLAREGQGDRGLASPG